MPIILFFGLLSISLSAQRITKFNDFYSHNGSKYKFENMEDIFVTNLDSYMKYKSAMKARRTTRSFGTVTLVAMGIGTIAPLVDNNVDNHCDLICLSTGQIIGIVTWFLIVPTVGTIGLISRVSYNNKRNKAISIYNDAKDIGYFNESSFELRIGGGQYGAGLIFNF